MQPTNTTPLDAEVKAYLFAQYYGHKIATTHESDGRNHLVVDGTLLCANLTEWRLDLRPLSSITDEEAIEVAKIISPLDTELHVKERGISIINCLLSNQTYLLNITNVIYVYQYLQQQSFALPVYFKGTHYTVERLVEEKIITLKN